MDKITNLAIDTIRTLSMDGVQKANSGHPGTPMALAPSAYILWKEIMKHNPENPNWFDRDRFILSNGHASMLIYSMLHLSGYDLSLEELKNFRQWGSKTPGHPEYGHTPGVETTTGPLGQGIGNAVGMAIAEKHLAGVFNTEKHEIVNHYTYTFCGDGDLMEGISHEAASIAGHLGLGKLICLFDDNHITIEGEAELSCTDDIAMRFESYGWETIDLGDKGNDIEAIGEALKAAKKNTEKPTLILLRTHIGYGAPELQDTSAAHGSPLGDEEIKATKKFYDWPSEEPFFIPEGVMEHMGAIKENGKKAENNWNQLLEEYKSSNPEKGKLFESYINQELPEGWDSELPSFTTEDSGPATRAINSSFLNAVADKLPWLIGGSADLEPSTKTKIKSSPYFQKNSPEGRNLAWGIRELGMTAATSGMQLHGGLRTYASTFFVFTDYARPAIRLAALMKQPVIYTMTHDSIGLGEDGPTHQPIEHLASLRAMPGLTVIRPADGNEAVAGWKVALERKDGPTMLVLTRQGLPILDSMETAEDGVRKGAYIVSPEAEGKLDGILIGTGSEVHLLIEAQKQLSEKGTNVRVVSMPSWELFEDQSDDYKDKVLPAEVKARLAVETGSPLGWNKWVGDKGSTITIDHFGASAPYKTIFEEFGFTTENIVNQFQAIR
ncbi:transketolase [Membranihabitans maritimus]|uniref:transketolase n=1 Tax=Membranihabitans maritimus TaxID=2904244 RepID=UPI001F024862|nr:transketolase [Membranihabitans maritimus]